LEGIRTNPLVEFKVAWTNEDAVEFKQVEGSCSGGSFSRAAEHQRGRSQIRGIPAWQLLKEQLPDYEFDHHRSKLGERPMTVGILPFLYPCVGQGFT